MIVPMKKVSLITLGDKKNETLKELRKLGILHIEITEGSGEKIVKLKEDVSLLENAVYSVGKPKNAETKEADREEVLTIAKDISSLMDEKKEHLAET